MIIDVLVLAPVACLILYYAGWRRPAQILAALVALIFLAILLLPIPRWLAAPLENDFPPQERLQNVTGIVIMGGGIERVIAGAQLAYDYPLAKIVLTGHDFAGPGARTLMDVGVDRKRLMIENTSLDTWNDLLRAKALAAPQPGQVWLLVSSAVHIPRAMGVARHLGWDMRPVGVHYLSRAQIPAGFDFAAKAVDVNEVMHEYLGLLAYRLEGRTDALFPRPQKAGF